MNKPSPVSNVKRPAHRPVTIDAKRTTVTLDQSTIDKARAIGGGNLSKGLRLAVCLFKI